MKFRNPWIDPRILQVRSAEVRSYLLRHGWKQVSPESESLLHFEKFSEGGSETIVSVPTKEQARDYTQRVIELITDLALAEDRYAGDVLTDILRQSPEFVPAASPGVPLSAEPAPK